MSKAPLSDSAVRKLTAAQRNLLIDHIDGEVPIILANNAWGSTIRNSLIKLGLLRPSHQAMRPRATVLTQDGRHAVGLILGDYAESLIRVGILEQENPLAVLRHLKSIRGMDDTKDKPPQPWRRSKPHYKT